MENNIYFSTNLGGKKTGIAILISDKVEIRAKNIARNKEGSYIVIK